MTAEVVVLNKQGIALAADSAVTIGRGSKIFSSANKIYTLSKYNPVGVMIYGNAALLRMPWELIVKTYRKKIGSKTFPKLQEHAEHFISYITTETRLFPEELQREDFILGVRSYYELLRKHLIEDVEKTIAEKKAINDSDARRISSKIISEHHSRWREAATFPALPQNHEASVLEKYRNALVEVRRRVFQQLPLTPRTQEKLLEIGVWTATRRMSGVTRPGRSGVVVAGFGEEEYFPSLRSYSVYGVLNDALHYIEDKDRCISIDTDTLAAVVPFAQSEMVQMFMEGIDPDYAKAVDRDMSVLFTRVPDVIVDNLPNISPTAAKGLKMHLRSVTAELLEKYKAKLEEHRQTSFVDPVISVVASLPKDELAAMAESLVNLTSFKRKVSMQAETVGGPIDVAVISKGDGFIWIRRKHYFRPELNHHFLTNYFREA